MTYFEAIKWSMELWWYLYYYFPIEKENTPFWEKIENFKGNCPLCHFGKVNKEGACFLCILHRENLCHLRSTDHEHYAFWVWTMNIINSKGIRQQAAYAIYKGLRDEYERLLLEVK